MSYQSFEQILQKCHTEGKEFWQVILEDDMACLLYTSDAADE